MQICFKDLCVDYRGEWNTPVLKSLLLKYNFFPRASLVRQSENVSSEANWQNHKGILLFGDFFAEKTTNFTSVLAFSKPGIACPLQLKTNFSRIYRFLPICTFVHCSSVFHCTCSYQWIHLRLFADELSIPCDSCVAILICFRNKLVSVFFSVKIFQQYTECWGCLFSSLEKHLFLEKVALRRKSAVSSKCIRFARHIVIHILQGENQYVILNESFRIPSKKLSIWLLSWQTTLNKKNESKTTIFQWKCYVACQVSGVLRYGSPDLWFVFECWQQSWWSGEHQNCKIIFDLTRFFFGLKKNKIPWRTAHNANGRIKGPITAKGVSFEQCNFHEDRSCFFGSLNRNFPDKKCLRY